MKPFFLLAAVSLMTTNAATAAVQFERFGSLVETLSSITTLPNVHDYDHDQVLGPLPIRMHQSTSVQTAGARSEAQTYLETNWWNSRHFQVIVEQGASLSVTSPDGLREISATCVAILQGRFTLTTAQYAQVDLTNSRSNDVEDGPRAEFVFYGNDGHTVIADWRADDPTILETGAWLTPGSWDFQLAVETNAGDIYPDALDWEYWGQIHLEIAFIPTPGAAAKLAPLALLAARRRR